VWRRRIWVLTGAAAALIGVVVAGVLAWPHLQRYVGLAPPRQVDRPIDPPLRGGAGARVLGIAHNAGNNPATTQAAIRNGADAIEVDVIAARGKLVAGREYQPWPGLARRLFRGPSLDDAWEQTGAAGLLKLDLKQSDAAFLDLVVAFLSSRPGSRTVVVSTPDRGAVMVLRDRLPGVQLVYSAGGPAAVERLQADPALVAAVSAISAFQGLVDADLLRWAHARDLKVFAWTVEGGPRLAQLVRLGVDGVTTANLAVLRALGGS